VQSATCAACGNALAARVPTAVFSHFAQPGPLRRNRTLRWVAAAGVVLAIAAALLVRGLLGAATIEAAGRPLETGVAAVARAEPAPDPAAALPYTPGWNPAAVRAVTDPTPTAMAVPSGSVEVMPPPPPAVGEVSADSGMVGFTPRPVKRRPVTGRAFTNDDLSGTSVAAN
jgi:hypothetical protein